MNPIKLTSEDGSLSVTACGSCREVAPKGYAETCCTCHVCGQPGPGIVGIGKAHSECLREMWDRREADRLERAEEVPYESGFVYSEWHGHREGYFDSMEDLCEWLSSEREPDDWPEYVFACKATRHRLDLNRALEDACQDGYEEMGDGLVLPPELEAAVEKFNDDNEAALTSWGQDTKRKHRVPLEELHADRGK
jgi:hypothetical protein